MRPDTIGNLEDIREAAGFIAEDTRGVTFETFVQDRRIRQLVVHNFLIIGEAISRIRRHDPATLAAISEGNLIVDMRNALIHGYDEINYRTVWRTVSQSLPVLVAEVEQLLSTGEPTRHVWGANDRLEYPIAGIASASPSAIAIGLCHHPEPARRRSRSAAADIVVGGPAPSDSCRSLACHSEAAAEESLCVVAITNERVGHGRRCGGEFFIPFRMTPERIRGPDGVVSGRALRAGMLRGFARSA